MTITVLSRKYSIPGAWMSPMGRAVNQQGGIDRPREVGIIVYHLLTLLHLPISKESKMSSLDSLTLFAYLPYIHTGIHSIWIKFVVDHITLIDFWESGLSTIFFKTRF